MISRSAAYARFSPCRAVASRIFASASPIFIESSFATVISPGCGDFSVLALYFKLMEKRQKQIPRENYATIAGIGCSSRFPYFVNGHGAHYIHGRALPFATGVSLSRYREPAASD